MNSPLLASTHHAGAIVVGLLLAIHATHLTIDHVRRIAAAESPMQWRWLAAGAVSAGTASWCATYLAILGTRWPSEVGHDASAIVLSWVVSTAVAAATLWMASRRRLRPLEQVAGATLVGAGIFAMLGISLAGLDAAGGIDRDRSWLIACAAASIGGSVASWPLLMRWRKKVTRDPLLHLSSATGAGLLLTALLYAALASVDPRGGEGAPPDGLLGDDAIATLLALAAPVTLAYSMLMSAFDARARTHASRLAETARDERDFQHSQQASYDVVTGLPNRQTFEARLARTVANADQHNGRVAVLFINLDGFKAINESLGHDHGDELLRLVASRLVQFVGSTDLVARTGADEFVLQLAENPTRGEVSEHVRRLLSGVAAPCRVGNRDLEVSCSIGISIYPDDGALSRLIAHADAAMTSAKRNGGATYCFFEARMIEHAREQVELLRDLRHAISNKQLELFYQPKIHAPSGQVTGAEALMRWHHPERGMVSPTVFIPIAERFGLITTLGNWLIDDACRQSREWRDKGLKMRIAINLSVQQLRQPDLVNRIASALKRNRIEARLLTCEFTESAAMDDADATLRVIRDLSALGVHLSIDDFGTGYSSLSYLRRLPADELKIDRSFVQDLETSADARAIVDAVMKMAQALGRKVVAEGVETQAQQAILSSLGCDELQGYLFAKPMSARALAIWAMTSQGPSDLSFRASLFSGTTVQGDAPVARREFARPDIDV